MPILLAVLVFLTITIVVFAFAAATVAPSSVLGARLREIGWQRPKDAESSPSASASSRLSTRSAALCPFRPPTSPKPAPGSFRPDTAAPSTSPSIAACASSSRPSASSSLFLISGFSSPFLLAGLFGFGFFIPRFLLKRQMQERQKRIRLGLPDALDLTVICVEAGLPLDQALTRVGSDLSHAHPELGDEFHLFDLEIRAGKPRVEALRNLAARTGVEDVRSLVGTLIQTDRFGTSVAQALRVHSDSLRTERRQRAEEQAAKTTVKMIIPLVLFVMPSLIFVTVGPAVIQLMRLLIPVTVSGHH